MVAPQAIKDVLDAKSAQDLLDDNCAHFAVLLAPDGTHAKDRIDESVKRLQENLRVLAAAADKNLLPAQPQQAGAINAPAAQGNAPQQVKQEPNNQVKPEASQVQTQQQLLLQQLQQQQQQLQQQAQRQQQEQQLFQQQQQVRPATASRPALGGAPHQQR